MLTCNQLRVYEGGLNDTGRCLVNGHIRGRDASIVGCNYLYWTWTVGIGGYSTMLFFHFLIVKLINWFEKAEEALDEDYGDDEE